MSPGYGEWGMGREQQQQHMGMRSGTISSPAHRWKGEKRAAIPQGRVEDEHRKKKRRSAQQQGLLGYPRVKEFPVVALLPSVPVAQSRQGLAPTAFALPQENARLQAGQAHHTSLSCCISS